MKKLSRFATNWLIAFVALTITLVVFFLLFAASISFIRWEIFTLELVQTLFLGRILMVVAGVLATTYIFSDAGRREWDV